MNNSDYINETLENNSINYKELSDDNIDNIDNVDNINSKEKQNNIDNLDNKNNKDNIDTLDNIVNRNSNNDFDFSTGEPIDKEALKNKEDIKLTKVQKDNSNDIDNKKEI